MRYDANDTNTIPANFRSEAAPKDAEEHMLLKSGLKYRVQCGVIRLRSTNYYSPASSKPTFSYFIFIYYHLFLISDLCLSGCDIS